MLALRDFRTVLDLSYLYRGNDSEFSGGRDRSSQSHTLRENLDVSLGYSIYKPKYWNGKVEASFGFDQNWYESSSQGGNDSDRTVYEYRVDGTLLKDSYAPLRLNALSSTQQIDRPFAKDYTREYDNVSAWLYVRNKNFPASLSVSHAETVSSGLALGRTQETDRVSLSVSNSYKNLSQTAFHFSVINDLNSTEGSSQDRAVDIKEYSATNHLYPLANRRLLHVKSYYRLRDETGTTEGRDYVWQEDLVWVPGEALTGKLLYEQNLQRSLDQEVLTRHVKARLDHQLFLSLDSDIEARGRRKEFSSGEEDNVSGTLGLVYTKRLNSDSRYTLRLVETYGVIDRTLETGSIFVIDEHLIIDPVFPNLLVSQNIVAGSIIVRDLLRTLVYVEGIDYLVFTVGSNTELVIPPGSAISSGDEVSIDYEYQVNPSVEYATETISAYTSLTFLNNQLTVYGRFSDTTHDLLSGSDDLLSLTASRVYAAGISGSFEPVYFGVNYIDSDTPPDSYISTDGYLTYAKNWDKRLFSLTIRDSYRKYEDENKGHNNAFSARADYHRRFQGNLTTKSAVAYRNSSGTNLEREDIALMFDLSIRVGRSLFSVEVDEEWLFYRDNKQRDDRVELKMQRFF